MQFVYFFALITCTSSASVFRSRSFTQGYFANNTNVSLCNDSLESVKFQTLLIEKGNIFVGATNAILQFNDDLSPLREFETGPGIDGESCIAPQYCAEDQALCSENTQCTNNYNTLLLTYRSRLLVCGTLHETCHLLMSDDITRVFGNRLDLQCPSGSPIRKITYITRRNRSLPIVAAVYVNRTQADDDLLYLGRSPAPIDTLIPPSLENSYFSIIDITERYLPEEYSARRAFYHLAWANEEYAYILWTDETNDQLKLTRYCHEVMSTYSRNDVEDEDNRVILNQGIRTYTEITLQCNSKGNFATEFVEAKVAFNTLYVLFRNNSNNAAKMCSTTIQSLNNNFEFVRSQCWNSNDSRNVANVIEEMNACSFRFDFSTEWVTCGFPEDYVTFLSPVEGVQPLVMDLKLDKELSDVVVTTFAVDMANGLLSAFIGTSEGTILKASLNGAESQTFTEKINTNQPAPILNILLFGENNDTLYALTKDAIYRTTTSNCSQYVSCNECIESRDVDCGWCVLASSCTERNGCPQNQSSNRWIFPLSSTNRCPRIDNLEPSIISFDEKSSFPITVTLNGTQLNSNLSYMCRFSVRENDIFLSEVTFDNFSEENSTGVCQYNSASVLRIPAGRDHQNVSIGIVYENNTVASGIIRVFSCERIRYLNRLSVCSSCASSEWGCSWCTSNADCSSGNTCDTALIGRENRSACPRISEISNMSTPIPVGQTHTFVLQAMSLPQPFNNYQCRYEFCNKSVTTIPTSIDETTAECTIHADMLTCPAVSESIQVFLVRLDDYFIDVSSLESSETEIKLFNCSATATNCGSCIAFRSDYEQCGWCGSSCVASSMCESRVVENISQCENGNISSIFPPNGTTEGGTTITIRGLNLGSNISDIESVSVANVACELISDQYIASEQVVCRTTATNRNGSGVVIINTSYGPPIKSIKEFSVKIVKALSFSSNPTLDGSTISFNGSNLDVGNDASISISNETAFCTNRNSTNVICKLPKVGMTGTFNLTLSIDGYRKSFLEPLELVAVPVVINSPTNIAVFTRAGRNLILKLNASVGVQTIELRVQNNPYTTACSHNETSHITCPIPPQNVLSRPAGSRKKRQVEQGPNSYEVKVFLNDVHNVYNGTIIYQTDPRVEGASLPCSSQAAVQIRGSGFSPSNTTFLPSEYKVKLIVDSAEASFAEFNCSVNHITEISVFCNVEKFTEFSSYNGENIQINVSVGELNITTVERCISEMNSILIAVPIASVALILVICIVALCCYQRKKGKQQEMERKLILTKLDDLENRTRETARNAYYELQLGYMENLADNITHRIIYLPPKYYFTQTFFNLLRGHPTLDKAALKNEPGRRMEAIKDWTKLLKNKDFLMIFIRTLEEQKKFTVQEKGNVASLLTVCLFSDMPYFTRIMFDLLMELIQKHVQKNPKLLLRRSESVVEKMVSHWLSITLYDECITEKSGEPIFLLAKAVHYLVTSGPCDVIANKSLNSLNESTLLGSELSYNTKILLASIQEEETEKISEPVEVSVVDVDTITQVKAKVIEAVYKDRPFSECPKPDDLDCEMLSGEAAKEGIVLSDIDHTSVMEGHITKINSIKHYNIPEKARVVLRPVGTLNLASPTSTSRSPLLSEGRNQMYHLIHPKDEDSSNGHVDLENGGGKRTDAVLEDLIKRPFQEIYLTRMVRAKTTVQEYVDKVFKSILCPEPIPHAVRYFFQFLDREAIRHKINDAEVVHIWKTNSLLLRYWVNVLKNPEFIFDIDKTIIVDSCLNVITQAFMDACTTTNRKLGYDSPSNKLLYAKEAQQYKKMVNEFFIKVSSTSWIKEEDMDKMLMKTSQTYAENFNQDVASQQLYQYLYRYKDQILNAVRSNEREDLASDIETLLAKMDDRNAQSETTVV